MQFSLLTFSSLMKVAWVYLIVSLSPLLGQLAPVRGMLDDNGNTLNRIWTHDANGRSVIRWEILSRGGSPESVHVWGEPANGQVASPVPETVASPGGLTDFPRDELNMGYPSPRLFQVVDGLIDALVLYEPSGSVGLVEFQKTNGKWLWTKWVPLGDYVMNSYPLEGRWLGPGKIEVWIPGTQGDANRSTFEMTGSFDPRNPGKQIALKDGKPYPFVAGDGGPRGTSRRGPSGKALPVDSK